MGLDLYESCNRAYYLTICAEGSSRPFTDPRLAHDVTAYLLEVARDARILVFAYCVMPDHLHVLCAPREDGISVIRFMDDFKGKSTRICWKHGLRGSVWQRGYYDHIVRQQENLAEITDYITDNPARRGLVDCRDDYPFCGTPDGFPIWW